MMKIGVIGAGNIGGALVRRFTQLGHEVEVCNSRGPETLAQLAEETGARAVSIDRVANGKDVVVVTIPLKNVALLPKDIFEHTAADAAIIDTNNYYPGRDGRIEAIESGMPESRWVQAQLGRPVVKVFNGIYAQHLLEKGKPRGDSARIALPVAGDVAKQKATVLALVDALGFEPVDAGGLDESWRQQPGSPSYGADLDAHRLRQALAEASPIRGPEWRA